MSSLPRQTTQGGRSRSDTLPVQVKVNHHEPGGHDDQCGSYGSTSETFVVQADLEVVAFTEFGEKFAMAIMGDVKGEHTPPTLPQTKISLQD